MMWFCYELENTEWIPVVYRSAHGLPETLPLAVRTEMVTVPEDCIGADNEPMFGRLKERFAAPVG